MSETAGSIYGALFEDQLKEEYARKTSFESRGLAVISTSAALVTLLLALGALVSKTDTFDLAPDATVFLIASCVLFVVATVLGLSTNWPLSYKQLAIDDLDRLLDDKFWGQSSGEARRHVAEGRFGVLERARKLNGLKGNLLLAGMAVEVAATVALACSVILLLVKG